MEVSDLMELTEKDALEALSWESLEFLFFPKTQLALFIRASYDATLEMLEDQNLLDTPEIKQMIEQENFYLKLRELHEFNYKEQ
jgi:hypothetical protein